MTFVDVSGLPHHTIHRMDHEIFDEIDAVVQMEPSEGADPELLGLLASIGIEKGKPFAPDERMQKILKDAAAIGAATARTLAARPRDEAFYWYPGKSYWSTPFVGGSQEFLANGARVLDSRTFFHFYATGITPAMAHAPVGVGSQYAVLYLDSEGQPFDGAETYSVTLPPNVPANDFWSFVVYDNQTRSMLQTDQRLPGVSSIGDDVQQNADGTYTIVFAPEAPDDPQSNWIQAIPGKGWNTVFRLYGPLEPWFDKTWRPGDAFPGE